MKCECISGFAGYSCEHVITTKSPSTTIKTQMMALKFTLLSNISHDYPTTFTLLGQNLLASGHSSGHIHIWNLTSASLTHSLVTGSSVNCLATFNPNNGFFASGSQRNTCHIWSIHDYSFKVIDDCGPVYSLAYLGKDRIASGSRQRIYIWDAIDGKLENFMMFSNANSFVNRLVSLGDGLLASLDASGKFVSIWYTNSPNSDYFKIEARDHFAQNASVTQLVSLDATRLLAIATSHGTIKTWNITDWRVKHTFESSQSVRVDFLAQVGARYLASASSGDGQINLWDLMSGRLKCVFDYAAKEKGRLMVMSWLGKGLLATGSVNGSISVWDISRILNE